MAKETTTKKATDNKAFEETIVYIKGELNFFGTFNEKTRSKHSKEMLSRFSIKNWEPATDDINDVFIKAFENAPELFTPDFVKELREGKKSEYINCKSQFDVKVYDTRNETVENIDVLPKSMVTVAIKVKDSAIYPVAIRIDKKGEVFNHFAGV